MMWNHGGKQNMNIFTRYPYFRTITLYLTAFTIGLIAGHGVLCLMPAALFFPCLYLMSRTWKDRWAIPFGYYGAYLITMFPGAAVFFGHHFDPAGITLLWLLFSALMSLPWAILCNNTRIRLFWAVPLSLLASTLPPIGLFSVGNPLLGAGVILPHTMWYGLGLIFLASGIVAAYPRVSIPTIAALTLISAIYFKPLPAPKGWEAHNTKLGGQGLDKRDLLRDYKTMLYVGDTIQQSTDHVLIFPEAIMDWNTTQELYLGPALNTLRARKHTLIVGATLLVPGHPDNYRNTAVVRGPVNTIVDERIPIPLTMWKPLTPEDGVRLNLFGPSTISPIDGQRAAILICYEQLLPLAALQSLYEHPTVLIGIANDYWAKDTYFPNIQSADMQAWGLLFHLPVLTSTNI